MTVSSVLSSPVHLFVSSYVSAQIFGHKARLIAFHVSDDAVTCQPCQTLSSLSTATSMKSIPPTSVAFGVKSGVVVTGTRSLAMCFQPGLG